MQPSRIVPQGLILIGLYGSGKASLVKAARILLTNPFHHFSSGDFFRQEIERESPLGAMIKDDVASGQYVSDATVNAACAQELPSILKISRSLWLDGVPRTDAQADFLFGDFFPEYEIHAGDFSIVEITTPVSVCEERIQNEDRSGRPDATVDSAMQRIQKDLEVLPGLLRHLGEIIPEERHYRFDGTHMRRMAPKFLRQMGFDIPVDKLEAYRATLPQEERDDVLV